MTTRLQRWMAPRIAARYPHLATVLEETAGPSSSLNVPTKVWTPTGQTFRVYRQRSDGSEQATDVGKTPTSNWLMFAPANPPCMTDNRLLILGQTFEVDDINPEVDTRTFISHAEIRCHLVTAPLAG